MSYFNTTNLDGSALVEARQITGEQDCLILKAFQRLKCDMSPREVHEYLIAQYDSNMELTSVRRSITNLTSAGLLVKRERTRMGKRGRPEYLWGVA